MSQTVEHAEEDLVAIGPEALTHIAMAVDQLGPLVDRLGFKVHPQGGVEFFDERAAEGAFALRQAVEAALPGEVRSRVGRKSGLRWHGFFSHVLGYWLGQRQQMGFLRALVDRAALHGVELRLHWNRHRTVEPIFRAPGPAVLVIGTVIGAVAGFLLTHKLGASQVIGMLSTGVGLVAARIYQRRVRYRVCGDRLCRAPIPLGVEQCPSCGAHT